MAKNHVPDKQENHTPSGRRSGKALTAYTKDIMRTIRGERRRFLAIMVITLLGVMMFSGLAAACKDLRKSADSFFTSQKLHDLNIVSTLGLTDDDIDALSSVDGVSVVSGIYREEVSADIGGNQMTIALETMTDSGIDRPYLTSGRLPSSSDEVAVTDQFLADNDVKIGDTFTIHETSDENESVDFTVDTFKIVGSVTDVRSIDNPFGSVSYRTDSTGSDTAFVLSEAVQSDLYTAAAILLDSTEHLDSFSSAYDNAVKDVQDVIENEIRPEREDARTDEVKEDAQKELDKEIAEARKEIDNAEEELNSRTQELAEQQTETESNNSSSSQIGLAEQLAEQQAEARKSLEKSRRELEETRAEKQAEIDEIEPAVWYVQNRSSLSGYSNVESDASSIEAIGTVFPIVFFIVAILISLTAITRMIDEDRGLIGTYKSLGYTDREIRRKYLSYAAAASLAGSAVGTVLAFIALPGFIFTIFKVMYLIPEYQFSFIPSYGFAGPAIFLAGILFAAYLACRNELRNVPAALMRPKSPRPGSSVLLERITPVWKRMSFLRKVTARNLFRYKKRMFMTIFGIGGCMALLLFGFSIKDSVNDLMPRQYDETFRYDFMAVSTSDDNGKLLKYVKEDPDVNAYINCVTDSARLILGEDEESVTLIAVPDNADFSKYIALKAVSGKKLTLDDGDIFITQNAGNVMGFSDSDTVTLETSGLDRADITVTALVRNYLGNFVYMRQSTWESLFGEYQPNGILGILNLPDDRQTDFCDALAKKDGVISCSGIEKMKDQFSGAFQLINAVVYVVIAMSAALAFAVLFTLSTTNISERTREIATIKVLGFYDREVHAYIDKETMILCLIGILIGLPLGWAFSRTLTSILNLPSIYLAVSLHTVSYIYAAGLTLIFAIAVSIIMDKVLDAIDPSTALKSVE